MRKLIFCAILAVIIVLSACSRMEKPHKKNKITLPISVQIHSLDPRKVTEHSGTQIINMIFEGLMRYDEHGNLDFGLAKTFSIDKTQTKYHFALREARWSNGEKITAHDIEYSWKEALNPKRSSVNTSLLFFVKNVKKYISGECAIDEIGVRALNDENLLVTLEDPAPFFLELLTSNLFTPVSRKVMEEGEERWGREISEKFVSSGPFRVKSFKPDLGLILEKNPFYWEKEVVSLDEIEIAYIPDTQTQAYLFKNGELDWFGQPIGAFDYDAYENIGKPETVHSRPVYASMWLQVNTEDSILSNINIRKALSYAINREEIVNHILLKRATASYSFLPKAFNIDRNYSFQINAIEDAQKAFQQGLEELGISKEEFPELKLDYVSIGLNKRIAQAIQSQVKDTLGITLSLHQKEWKVLVDQTIKGKFQLVTMAWVSSYSDPMYFFLLFEEKYGKNNYPRWEKPEYSRLIKQLRKEKSGKKRHDLIVQLDEILSSEQPVIPIYDSMYSYAVSKRLKNIVFSDMGVVDFKYATIDEAEKNE